MDKYTVDLDQVLNDFEYSELTDQHSKNVSERPQSNPPFQPAPVTKHSINNVFHSLNEYLNSGINSGVASSSLGDSYAPEDSEKLPVNDNKIEYNAEQVFSGVGEGQDSLDNIIHQNEEITCKNGHKDINQVEVDQGILTSVAQEPSSIAENSKEETSTNCEQSKLEHLETVIFTNDFEETNVHSIKTETPLFSLLETENAESKFLPEVNCTENLSEQELTNVNNDLDCDRNVINKADSELGKDDLKENYSEANSSYESARGEVDVQSVEIMEHKYDLSENREDILVKIEEDSVNNETQLEDFVIEVSNSPYALGTSDFQQKSEKLSEKSIEKEDTTSNKDIEPESREFNNTATSAKENADDSVIATEVVNLSEDVNNLESEPKSDLDKTVTPPKVIGFLTNIDIDESELNKMLEELALEEDFDHAHVEEVTVEHVKEELDANEGSINNEENVLENITNVNEDPNEVENVNMVDPVSNIQATNPDSQPTLNEQTVLVNSDNVESQIPNTEPTEENIHSKIIECLEMEKPSNKSKKTSKKPAKTSQESIPIIEPAGETSEQEVKNEIEPSQEKEGLSRPQNLPLNNEVSDENSGRKINLIGSPGSTPYNNVYINKSIEPKTTQDIESDYTSSASPTFSDCSTESTSTASTVSVEDVPNNADKFTKKSSGIKNTNVESESRESRKDRNSVENVGEKDTNVQESTNSGQNRNIEEAASINDEATTNATENTNSETGAGDVQSSQSTDTFLDKSWLGKEAPLWIPDADASSCLHCDMKFTVLKRRHHCRACGLVLCSKCCNLKFRLEYLESDARVCNKCYDILNKDTPNNAGSNHNSPESGNSPAFRPNPNNPLEYCSTVSPLQQAGQAGAPPPSVMVPVGVLKRKGSNKKSNKSVMFCDGIAPGSDLTQLDQDFNYNTDSKTQKSLHKGPEEEVEKKKTKEEPPPPPPAVAPAAKVSRNQPKIDEDTGCFIPKSETSLPPTVSVNKTDILYSDCSNAPSVVEMLKNESLVFAINQNLFVNVKVINMSCCINKQAWCFCTEGLINVGSDEVVYLIEYIEEESFVPKDVFFHIYNVYADAVKGTSIKELGLSLHNTSNFLDSRNHAGFVYIKPTFQCLENLIVPKEPFLIGILIHRWETPWAKLFPLRLILRLGAEYRYYPSPLISTRHRDSVFVEIGHTIINLLADFRNFTYTLPQIRGLIIHMEDKKTTITIPKNRYDQVMKSINNSSEHILAFAGNFSSEADSHLVCIQDTQGHENCYTTHAINIHNKPRKVTGASFIVFNGSLKSSSGLTAKSNIVEDGLMIQIPSEHMDKIRDNLRNMKNHTIACGCINAVSDETVNIVWGENDVDFNAGVNSPVDLAAMKGVPSIRVHNGKDYFCNTGTRLIRWTEVFIMQSGEENPKHQDPVDISKVSESIAKACCTALVKYLDLLVSNSCQKIGIRTTLHVENVSYSAGSNGLKLPPIYMRSLDNELIPVLHRITSNNLGDNAIVLELIFRILNA